MHDFSEKPLAGEEEVLVEQDERLRQLFAGIGQISESWVIADKDEEEDDDWDEDDDDDDWDDDDDDDDWDDDDDDDDADE